MTEFGFLAMFTRIDSDGSGDLDVDEFIQVAREECHIKSSSVSDDELRLIFTEVDKDDSGSVSASEFVQWLQSNLIDISIANELALAEQHELETLKAVKIRFRQHSSDAVADQGWKQLFRRYDKDGDGEIDMVEFRLAVRNDCEISRAVVSDREVGELFKAVDCDGGGSVNADEFKAFLLSDAFAKDMSIEVFSRAMHVLCDVWVTSNDVKQHAEFLRRTFNRITKRVEQPDGSFAYQLKGIQIRRDADGNLVYDISDVNDVESFVDSKTGKLAMEGVTLRNANDNDDSDADEMPREPTPPPTEPTRKPLYDAPKRVPTPPPKDPTPEPPDWAEQDSKKLRKRVRNIELIIQEGDSHLRRPPVSAFSSQKAIEAYRRALEVAACCDEDLYLGTGGKYIGDSFTPWNFEEHPEDLTLLINGIKKKVELSTNIATIEMAVATLQTCFQGVLVRTCLIGRLRLRRRVISIETTDLGNGMMVDLVDSETGVDAKALFGDGTAYEGTGNNGGGNAALLQQRLAIEQLMISVEQKLEMAQQLQTQALQQQRAEKLKRELMLQKSQDDRLKAQQEEAQRLKLQNEERKRRKKAEVD
eukprot:SAG31_NODE_5670_length_2392_cov_1.739206_2_plen_588_part_01